MSQELEQKLEQGIVQDVEYSTENIQEDEYEEVFLTDDLPPKQTTSTFDFTSMKKSLDSVPSTKIRNIMTGCQSCTYGCTCPPDYGNIRILYPHLMSTKTPVYIDTKIPLYISNMI